MARTMGEDMKRWAANVALLDRAGYTAQQLREGAAMASAQTKTTAPLSAARVLGAVLETLGEPVYVEKDTMTRVDPEQYEIVEATIGDRAYLAPGRTVWCLRKKDDGRTPVSTAPQTMKQLRDQLEEAVRRQLRAEVARSDAQLEIQRANERATKAAQAAEKRVATLAADNRRLQEIVAGYESKLSTHAVGARRLEL